MPSIPIGFDPMLGAKCFASAFVPEALFVAFGVIAVAAVVFLAMLPLALRDGSARPADQEPPPRRHALDEGATSEEDVVEVDERTIALANGSGRSPRAGGAPLSALQA
jgi:hypothetical protein